jgi:hypothetical protein
LALIATSAPRPRVLKSVCHFFYFRPVVLIALLDSSVPFAYFLQTSSLDLWYGLTLSIKTLICISSPETVVFSSLLGFSLYGVIAIILVSSSLGGSEIGDYLRTCAFVGNLFLTLLITRRNNLVAYVGACVCAIGASTILYLAAVQTGSVLAIWGRFSYFGGSHPNLGSEIIAISIVLAACVLPSKWLLLYSAPSLYAINLMQGRSALIVAMSGVVIKLFFSINKPRNQIITAVLLLVTGLILFLFFFNEVSFYVNSMFLFDDEYRGAGTGFVGRDQAWAGAWKLFLESPIIGNGVGYAERVGVEPHNFFFYGLSQFGMMSFLVFGTIFFLYYDLYRSDRQWFYALCTIPILWMFNDRFFNLNPYPFILYVVLFAHANNSKSPSE